MKAAAEGTSSAPVHDAVVVSTHDTMPLVHALVQRSAAPLVTAAPDNDWAAPHDEVCQLHTARYGGKKGRDGAWNYDVQTPGTCCCCTRMVSGIAAVPAADVGDTDDRDAVVPPNRSSRADCDDSDDPWTLAACGGWARDYLYAPAARKPVGCESVGSWDGTVVVEEGHAYWIDYRHWRIL